MENNVLCPKMQAGVKKVKKKLVKDEMDRIKQAEKKKRRLEKALATSAAIRLELEKKKQKKMEEQQRLDEEGAAIAEAVALNVLLEEESEDSYQLMLKKYYGHCPWDCLNRNVVLFSGGHGFNFPHQNISKCSSEEASWVPSNDYGSQWEAGFKMCWPVSSCISSVYAPYYNDDACLVNEDCTSEADVIAAQALSSLRIADGSSNLDTVIFNGVSRV